MEKELDHLGIAVRNLEESIVFYQQILGGTLIDRYRSEAIGVESEIAIMDIKGARTELLMPTNNATSPHRPLYKAKRQGCSSHRLSGSKS
ncbi:lactoylglutathione lyase and related lyases [Gracilibacillus boraciitolerans JCM 21714]|uniref:Lactoylglutathione lyase and related lyases n=1 Tax=Gracilibacillus boraciitolerans JCM 21714 TaxID=1298598 RepID=W4VPR2_9BACI|nr:lactoylglutathione lyase and related lyases [Gracilibacillus boraciitolerans JCM 21714]